MLSFTQAELCDTPFCKISRDNCAIPHKKARKSFAIQSLQASRDMKSIAAERPPKVVLEGAAYGTKKKKTKNSQPPAARNVPWPTIPGFPSKCAQRMCKSWDINASIILITCCHKGGQGRSQASHGLCQSHPLKGRLNTIQDRVASSTDLLTR